MLALISIRLFAFSIIFFSFGIYVLVIKFTSLKNRMFFSLCLHLSIWSLGYAFMVIAPNMETANFWRVFASIGWNFVYALWLDFAILVKNENKKWMTDFRRLLIYLPSFCFFIRDLSYKPIEVIRRYSGFWRDTYQVDTSEILYTIYYLVYILAGIFIIYQWGKESTLIREKKQAKVIVITTIISFSLQIINITILPLFHVYIFSFDVFFNVIALLGMYQAVNKYQMMTLTSQIANDYVLRTISDPVILIDSNLYIVEINDSTLKLTGYEENELLGFKINKLISDDKLKEDLRNIILSGPISNREIELKAKDNRIISCLFSKSDINSVFSNESNNELGIICIFHDITDRKNLEYVLLNKQQELEYIVHERTKELEEINKQLGEEITERTMIEESLRASEEKFRALIMQSSEGIIVIDHNTMACLECNDSAKKILGFSMYMIPDIMKERTKIDNVDRLEKAINQLIDKKVDAFKEVIKYTKADGVCRNLELSIALIGYSDKQLLMITIRDVTEELIMEERQQQIVKMESLGTLSGGIAHDFNNILAGIMGYTQLSIMDLEKKALLQENLTEIMKLGDRAKKLISQILTFSKNTIINSEKVSLDHIVDDILKMLKSTLPSNINIENLSENTLHNVYADSSEMHQLVMNLCVNAGMSMSTNGGTLVVELTNITIERDMEVHYQILKKGEYVKLEVKDNGCGMEDDVIKRIFEPFYTTRGNHGGTGLGLSVVHGIISRMKGVIMVESLPGKGSTFTVFIPALDHNRKEQPAMKESIKNGAARILLVDDEESIVKSVQKLLERSGYIVSGAINAKEALELFYKDRNAFDIVLTDQSMPDMSGDDLLHELRRIRPELPIIICSGFIQDMDYEEIQRTAYLLKPVSLNEYIKVIEELLNNSKNK